MFGISQRRLKNIKSWIKFFLAIICVAVFVTFYLFNIWSPLKKPVTVVVKPGVSVTRLTNQLVKSGVVKSGRLFQFSVKLKGGTIMAGEYDIPRGAGVWPIADMITKGRIATTTITIPEGYTIKQIKNLLNASSSFSGDTECDFDAPVCNLKDGDVFPDTYRVARGISRLAVLDLARKKMIEIKQTLDTQKYPSPLKNWNDVLTLASIVQKETPLKREMPIVASVYLNRLRVRMRLQADPTVVYALTEGEGDMHGEPLLSGHLKIDSPYNTYKHYGLPPAPIASVGRDAIRAVLNPEKTQYLFFVADGQGGHKFSTDFEEHKKNRIDWRVIKKGLAR
jgi:UPF0755 protein